MFGTYEKLVRLFGKYKRTYLVRWGQISLTIVIKILVLIVEGSKGAPE